VAVAATAMKMKMNLKYWIIAPKQTFYVQQIESFKFKSQESLDSASSTSSSSVDDDEVRFFDTDFGELWKKVNDFCGR
jgi:hypothetical protein